MLDDWALVQFNSVILVCFGSWRPFAQVGSKHYPDGSAFYVQQKEAMIMTSKSALIVPFVVLMAWLFVTPKTAAAQSTAPLEKGKYNTVELLRLMDKDRNGKVSRAEFDSFMNKEFDSLDEKRDGELDENELAQLHWNYLSTQLLPLMDKDKSGKVSRSEFMSFMNQEFDRLDTNHDGLLDVDELAEMHLKYSHATSR